MRPPYDFRIVIHWEDLRDIPASVWFCKRATQLVEGAKALFDVPNDNSRFLLDYQGIYFTMQFTASKFDEGVSYSIALWSPIESISLGSYTWRVGNKILYSGNTHYVPDATLDEMHKVLADYRMGKIPCTICGTVTAREEITFFPFAGGACPECKEAGRIPKVQTD